MCFSLIVFSLPAAVWRVSIQLDAMTITAKTSRHSDFHTNSNSALKKKQKNKKERPQCCVYMWRLTSFLCVCWWKRLYNVPPESLMMRTTRFSIDQTTKNKQTNKKTAKQPKRAYIVSLQNYPRSRLSLDGHLHTGHLKSARSALTPRLFEEKKDSHSRRPPPVSLIFYQWFFSFKSFIIIIIRQQH